MIKNVHEHEICKHRLLKLQTWAEEIGTNPNTSEFAKELELAGVRGMIEQLQQEIESFESPPIKPPIDTKSRWNLKDKEKYDFCFLRIDINPGCYLLTTVPLPLSIGSNLT